MLNFAPPKAIQLRDYQDQAVDDLRDGIRQGQKRQLLVAGTGAGKTLTSAHILNEAASKNSYTLFIVDRVSLVDQTSAVFDDYGIAHGVVQGNHPRWAPRENVQVCSAQTLARRSLPRDPDLIIVDEAHVQYKSTLDFMKAHPEAVKIGLTATPFTAGMAEYWDRVVNIIPTRQLINGGHLVEPTIYIAKSPEDSEFRLNSYGEFSEDGATKAGIQIIGDVVQEWIEKTRENFGGPVKTIVFSPTVEHGRELCAAFAASGYDFQQVSYLDKDDDERRAKIEEFRKADTTIHGLVSCGVLTRGFDVPDVRCGISCRPYRKSLSSHLQEIGRVMRPHGEGKTAIWLDHSGNIERFALDMFDVWENGAGELSRATKRDSTARERSEKAREAVVCKECGGAMRGTTCLSCGWERPPRSSVVTLAGEMHEFSLDGITMEPRPGLRAECLKEPRKIWEAALCYTSERSRKGEQHARKWAYGVFRGIYPNNKLPFGWFDMPVSRRVDEHAYALIEREVKRFRKKRRAA